MFAATHPTGHFPHRALLLISGLATLACLADLGTVIAALLTSRILIQFVGQIATVFYLRAQGTATRAHLSDAVIPLAGPGCTGRLAVRLLHVETAGPDLRRCVARCGSGRLFSSGTASLEREKTTHRGLKNKFRRGRTPAANERVFRPRSFALSLPSLPALRVISKTITTFRPGWEGALPSPVRS